MAPPPVRILLVEDDPMDIELTLDAFDEIEMKSTVHVARGGREGLDYLRGTGAYADRARYPLPDIILLDLKMPDVDGHAVLREVKATPGIRRLPVVVLTSSKEEGDLITSYDNGANSYLVKPISFNGFLEVVETIAQYWLTLNVRPPAYLPS